MRVGLMRSRTFLLAVSLLASTAALAAASGTKLLDRNSEPCRELQPYLETARYVARNDPDVLHLFLRARANASECYALMQNWRSAGL
jgi:hypothetical protein